MDYFELLQNDKVQNAINILKLDQTAYCSRMNQKEFEALDKLKVAYYSGREYEEACAVLTSPAFLVADGLKRLLERYDREISWKGVQLFPTDDESKCFPLYWVPFFPMADCLHERSKTYDNGMIRRLVIDGSKAGERCVFRISGLLEYKVMVSLPVAESILRRRFYGIELRKAEVI